MKERVLVLTSGTGSGHDMRARAFAQWVQQLHGDAVEVRIEQIIENGSLLGRFGVWVYNTIQQHAPFLHNIYFFIVELFVLAHSQSVSFGGRYYRKLLREYLPKVILSVHDSTNRGYFEDARRVLGDRVRCVTYCGEFSGGFGYSRNWINPTTDHFIARTPPAAEFAVKLGISPDRLSVFQKFLPPGCFRSRITDSGKADYLRQLGLQPGVFTLFLSTGGYGANHHLTFLKELLPLAGKIQVIVICGRNREVFRKVNQWAARNPGLSLHVEGYSDRVADYMQISDAILTRGGANTTMEALHYGCPILYNSLGGLMPQEQCTVRYFIDNGAAVLIRSAGGLANTLRQWHDFSAPYRSVRAALEALQVDEDPADLVRTILGPGNPSGDRH